MSAAFCSYNQNRPYRNWTTTSFKQIFVEEQNSSMEELEKMANTWVCVEDDPDVIEAEVEELIEELQTTKTLMQLENLMRMHQMMKRGLKKH